MNKRSKKSWTAEQVLDAIKQFNMEITPDIMGWYVYSPTYGCSAENCNTLEAAVHKCARQCEKERADVLKREEAREREEYERLKAKYGDNQ